jgi:hypothetical protein
MLRLQNLAEASRAATAHAALATSAGKEMLLRVWLPVLCCACCERFLNPYTLPAAAAGMPWRRRSVQQVRPVA